jgi:hypothetical protein
MTNTESSHLHRESKNVKCIKGWSGMMVARSQRRRVGSWSSKGS